MAHRSLGAGAAPAVVARSASAIETIPGIDGSVGIALAGLVVEPLGTTGPFVFEAAIAAAALPVAMRLARVRPR
jgi:hypothetical protein